MVFTDAKEICNMIISVNPVPIQDLCEFNIPRLASMS